MINCFQHRASSLQLYHPLPPHALGKIDPYIHRLWGKKTGMDQAEGPVLTLGEQDVFRVTQNSPF